MNNSDLIFNLLGISNDVPLDEEAMARSLTVTFLPPHRRNKRLDAFVSKLRKSFEELGTKILPYEDALISEDDQRVKPGIVLIEQGEGEDDNLAIRKVSSLYHNPVVAVFDGPPPIPENPTLQETLDSIVGVLAWNLSHVPIFLEDDKWTICTMNGAVIECGNWESPKEDILNSLVPKLSAQVVPPKREEIVYREGVLDPEKQGYGKYIEDFMSGAKVWRDNGLMLAHTSIEDLEYRNRYYRRIVSKYLDHRTGMSYGFMVRQLPTPVEPALEFESAPRELQSADWDSEPVAEYNDELFSKIYLFEKDWIVKIPEIWLLSTRSGCNKTNLNPEKDILRLGLQNREITLETPKSISAAKCRPSYDTYAILAHALGNVITASLLLAAKKDSKFPDVLQSDGLSISHWHGYPKNDFPLPGYIFHGVENPPVSCSTPQSAAYALAGKLRALEKNWDQIDGYNGDVHVEPHHGTNITGCKSITETAKWVDRMHKSKMAEATT